MEKVLLKNLPIGGEPNKIYSCLQFERINKSVKRVNGKNGWLPKLINSHTFAKKSNSEKVLIVLNPYELASQITEFYMENPIWKSEIVYELSSALAFHIVKFYQENPNRKGQNPLHFVASMGNIQESPRKSW